MPMRQGESLETFEARLRQEHANSGFDRLEQLRAMRSTLTGSERQRAERFIAQQAGPDAVARMDAADREQREAQAAAREQAEQARAEARHAAAAETAEYLATASVADMSPDEVSAFERQHGISSRY